MLWLGVIGVTGITDYILKGQEYVRELPRSDRGRGRRVILVNTWWALSLLSKSIKHFQLKCCFSMWFFLLCHCCFFDLRQVYNSYHSCLLHKNLLITAKMAVSVGWPPVWLWKGAHLCPIVRTKAKKEFCDDVGDATAVWTEGLKTRLSGQNLDKWVPLGAGTVWHHLPVLYSHMSSLVEFKKLFGFCT